MNEPKQRMEARTMLAEMDVRTDQFGHRVIFSVKIVTTTGKLYFFPNAYACGCGQMNMREMRYRGIQPCDCKGNPEGHIVPVKITNIIEFNERKIDWSNGYTI